MPESTVTGTLEYLTWCDHPWSVQDSTGEIIDLKSLFWTFAKRYRGKPVRQDCGLGSYKLIADPTSEYDLDIEDFGAGILLTKELRGGFGFTNVLAYLEQSMVRLNARRVIIELDEVTFSLREDPDDKVFGVYYMEPGNSARVPLGAEHTVCKVGTAEACIFASFGSGGFQCEKFNGPTARHLLHRKAEGTIRAQRIGNCAILGREEATEDRS